MAAYLEMIEDDKGDLVDIIYYCEWHKPKDVLPWPGYDWPDYDCFCEVCSDPVHIHKVMGDDDDE